MSAPSVGLAIIAKNEQEALPRLLESVRGAFDRVVLTDTGSTDDTVNVFEAWAAEEIGAGRLGSYLTDHFDWVDDFAEARRYAHARLGTEWEVWADCDDVIRGADKLRALAAQAPPDLAAFICHYAYAHDPHGNIVCSLQRERLVRAGASRWVGRVHEAQEIDGAATWVGPELVEWVHGKNPEAVDPARNLRILKAWERDEPENPRVLGYLGTEQLARGNARQAVRWLRRYLKLKTGWDEERAQVHRKLGVAYGELGRDEDAIATAFEAVALLPEWPDSYLTLAECFLRKGQLHKALHWCEEVIRRGVPQTLLIINPQEYVVQPRVLKAAALADLGDIEGAIATAEEALQVVPDHPIRGHYEAWRGARKRERTAEATLALAQTLVAHDEQLKALEVLRAAPHYVEDHPQVVAWRSMLNEKVVTLSDPDGYAKHYRDGGSKPEDMIPDEHVLELGDALPRCGFLLSGLQMQAAAA